MKFLAKIFLLTVIDFCIIWLWVKTMDSDPSVSIGILLLVPSIIAVNLLIALVLFFTKRQLSKFFLINALISAILIYFLFNDGISRYQRNRLESWEFKVNGTTYGIIYWKLENTFSMSKGGIQVLRWNFWKESLLLPKMNII